MKWLKQTPKNIFKKHDPSERAPVLISDFKCGQMQLEGGKHRLLFSDLPKSVCSRGRDEKRLTLPTCKINALKVVVPNRLGTVNCLDIFAHRGSWKDASHSWDIADSAAS